VIAELREVLVGAGYSGEALQDVLGADGHGRPPEAVRPVQRRRLAGRGTFGTITALFALDEPVPAVEANRALAPLTFERLQTIGLLEPAGGLVRAQVRLLPHNDLLLVSDLTQPGRPRPADHVAGVQGPSVTLSHLTVRRRVASTLDVGTGCGFQALLAARHAGRVVATDVNERALNFAAFNALLNGLPSIELRSGSLFEPVGGERYELVVCNPPYVISPENAYLVRDSGLPGDTLSEQVVRQAPAALAEGAFAQMLVSWAHHPGEDWSARPRAWVAETGCDALLLHYATQDPLTHAASWAREPSHGDEAALDAMLGRWLAYLADEGIEGIGYGAVVLRRRAGAKNWVAAQKLPAHGLRPAGEQILRIFAAHDLLAGLSDDTPLLDQRLALAEAAVVEQRVILRDGGWVSEAIEIRLEEGLLSSVRVDPPIAHLLASLDGQRTLAEVTTALAADHRVDTAELASRAVPVVRGLLELGLLQTSR
jgi:methylase of polypeptide subunit release factors